MLPVYDIDGTCIPFAEDDAWIECGLDDPDYDDPAEWPEWTDASVWEEGPAIPPDAVIVPPGLDDQAEPYEPTEQDWASYREWSLDVENRLFLARMASDFDDVQEAAF